MEKSRGIVLKCVGGLYTVRDSGGAGDIKCRARGLFRHNDISPEPGDNVLIECENSWGSSSVITEIVDRRSLLIRPSVANLDTMFVTLSAARPATVLQTADKLISSLEHNGIEPVIVVTKSDLDPDEADKLRNIYLRAGFSVFVTGKGGRGTEELKEYIRSSAGNGISAFSGASGVGKSTVINALFTTDILKTGTVSERTGRGRHTTRAVELYPLDEMGFPECRGFLADTPGFSALDFIEFDFFEIGELPENFREFRDYLGTCRYKKCTHLKEEGCSILKAVEEGIIPQSRHESYKAIYSEMKKRKPWEKRS